MAMQQGPQALKPFYGPARGFSFSREIQPILNQHCIRCHDGTAGPDKAFGLTGQAQHDTTAKRYWSEAYLALTGAESVTAARGRSDREQVNWIDAQSRPSLLPPYYRGSARSGLLDQLRAGHGETDLDREALDKIAAWIDLGVPFCGDYLEANAWTREEMDKYTHYQRKREGLARADRQNIERWYREQYRIPIDLPDVEARYLEYRSAGPGLGTPPITDTR
jgi:hypothetical protein